MPISEFGIIRRFFLEAGLYRPDVALGIGDDAAILTVPPGQEIVTATVPLTANGDHALPPNPSFLGTWSITSGLAQLAAYGASPVWLTLSLTLPEANEEWLGCFSTGLRTTTVEYEIQLVGGDTTRGPFNLILFALGLVPVGKAIGPTGARPGDLIYLTGNPENPLSGRLPRPSVTPPPHRDTAMPTPRIAEGIALRGLATACSTILGDDPAAALAAIMNANGAGATIYGKPPAAQPDLDPPSDANQNTPTPSTGPGKFELCFALPPNKQKELEGRFKHLASRCTCIGSIVDE
ncbi:MAG: thiamine-phosphate kinase [Gammaproteobacteria bacterium]|nr:thiamine-phosphate kinase [Gammaproteobacteria bacterium]